MRHVRAPRARRRRAWGPSGDLLGLDAQKAGVGRGWGGRCCLGSGYARLCLEAGFHGLGESGRWLGKEAAWWALGNGGGRNAGGFGR